MFTTRPDHLIDSSIRWALIVGLTAAAALLIHVVALAITFATLAGA